MRLIYLYNSFLVCVAFVECCDFSELSGTILGCVHDDKEVHIESAQNGTIATGSVCIVENSLGVQHIQCDDKQWIIHQEVIDNKSHRRRKRGFWRRLGRFFGNVFKGVVCVASLFTACAFGDRRPSDRTPPGMTCAPPKIFVTAEPFSYVARATWQEPVASDETDGRITPRLIQGYPPGHNFPENDTTVIYKATDRSGNSAYCKIIVIVKVVRCDPPKHINNGYFQCYPVTEHLKGGTCKFGCYEGYELAGGPDHVYCKDNGQWSDSQPYCKRKMKFVSLT
ncbi:sushi repeat-containing protein SRPX-like [Ruditapes philippinarum]|uniref:sushi repeat-containing protein SRPX-like n=1 Tax=Ruditapes philippinarum TaxID=129788 RepID=UPI00295B55A0|nr:sushi repeat-containing protein SRPX-like [Ruditapes philippinarum]